MDEMEVRNLKSIGNAISEEALDMKFVDSLETSNATEWNIACLLGLDRFNEGEKFHFHWESHQ